MEIAFNLKGGKVKRIVTILAGCMMVLAAGCDGPSRETILEKENQELAREKKQLILQIEESNSEIETLQKHLNVLAKLKPSIRLETLSNTQDVKITRYTGLYDKDKDGVKEKLIVYILPIDSQGDTIKAAGAVDVQLWDLNKPAEKAMLAQWRIEPDELKKRWFSTIVKTNYRLTFDIADILTGNEESLTVKAIFTDYLTGKVFNIQREIKP